MPIEADELAAQLVWHIPTPAEQGALAQRLAPLVAAYQLEWKKQYEASAPVIDYAMSEAAVRSFAPDFPYFKQLDNEQRAFAKLDRELLVQARAMMDRPAAAAQDPQLDALLKWRRRAVALSEVLASAPWVADYLPADCEQSVAAAVAACAPGKAPALADPPVDVRQVMATYAAERTRLIDALRTQARESQRIAARIEMQYESRAQARRARGEAVQEQALADAIFAEKSAPVRCALAELCEYQRRWCAEVAPASKLRTWTVRQAMLCADQGEPFAGTGRAALLDRAIDAALAAQGLDAGARERGMAIAEAWRAADGALAAQALQHAIDAHRAACAAGAAVDSVASPGEASPGAKSHDAAAATPTPVEQRAQLGARVIADLQAAGVIVQLPATPAAPAASATPAVPAVPAPPAAPTAPASAAPATGSPKP